MDSSNNITFSLLAKMTDKQKNFREKEHDNQKGRKRYRERLVEEEEAEKEIDLFKKRPRKEYDSYSNINNFDDTTEHPE